MYKGQAPGSAAALTEHNEALGRLLRRDPPLREGKRNELDLPTLRLSWEAREILVDYADATERAMGADGDLRPICAFAAKSAEQAARMAGVLTLYANPDATEINAEMMGRATELAQYYLGEALRLIDAATVDKELKETLDIPPEVERSITITFGKPQGRHGPLRRFPVQELVFDDGWEQPAWWVEDPPDARLSRSRMSVAKDDTLK